MKSNQWVPVPGADAELFQMLHRADLTSCNSYVIRFPACCVVIDPGGLFSQGSAICNVLHKDEARRDMPVYIFLTHCHYDHTHSLHEPWAEMKRPFFLGGHFAAVKVLEEGNSELSLAFLYSEKIPAVKSDFSLFTAGGVPSDIPLTCAEPKRVCIGDESAFHQWITLPGGARIEAFHTPGHSPDSVSYRIGSLLFVGDLFFAHRPIVAGSPGWSQPDLMRSLRFMKRYIETTPISTLGGHGGACDAETSLRIMKSALRELPALEQLACVDENRIGFLRKSTSIFMREIEWQSSVQGGRILRLMHGLIELEEDSFADEIAAQFDQDELEQYFHDFYQFVSAESSNLLQASIPLQGVQMMKKLGSALALLNAPQSLVAPYLERMEILFKSYVNLMRGIDLRQFAVPVNLTESIDKSVRRLSQHALNEEQVDGLIESPEQFSLYLVRRLDGSTRLGSVELDSQQTVNCRVDPDHLNAMVSDIVEILMSGDSRKTTLVPFNGDRWVGYRFYCSPSHPFSVQKIEFYSLFAEFLGGEFRLHDSTTFSLGFPFTEPDAV
jgi:glyoxylase-like metal-dependent hydrolase (beta-lactamase superfamily II)